MNSRRPFRRFFGVLRRPIVHLEKAPAPSPFDHIDPARLARMEAALVSMPDLTREVFMMHRFDDLPYRRIAVRVGIGVDEVEAHMATAIKLLGRAARGESV